MQPRTGGRMIEEMGVSKNIETGIHNIQPVHFRMDSKSSRPGGLLEAAALADSWVDRLNQGQEIHLFYE